MFEIIITMASESNQDVHCVGKNIPRAKRKLQKHLRHAGLAYVSKKGNIIPAKQVADELCQCPQKCNDRVTRSDRENLFKYFYQVLGDADMQNRFLRAHMDVKARPRPLLPEPEPPLLPGTRPPRRITCKYLLPLLPSEVDKIEVCQKAFCSAFVISTKRVRLQREKLIHSLGLNSYHHQRSVKKKRKPDDTNDLSVPSPALPANLQVFIDNCDQRLNNIVDRSSNSSNLIDGNLNRPINQSPQTLINPDQLEITPIKFAIDGASKPKKFSRVLVDDPLIPMGIEVPDGVTIVPVTATPDHDRDIAIVNNFFSNQLWKPEYIGALS